MIEFVETSEEGKLLEAIFDTPGISAAVKHFKEDRKGFLDTLRAHVGDNEIFEEQFMWLFEQGYRYGLHRGVHGNFDKFE